MDEPDLHGPSDDALSLSDDVDDAEMPSDDAAGARRRARRHLYAAVERPDDAECTEEEFLVKLLIEDDISMDQERLFRVLILLDEWNRKAPRPRDHGDPVTQGTHQTTNPQLARAHFEWLLEAPELVFGDLFRMPKAVFFALCRWLRNNTIAGDSQEMYLEQKVLIILWIFAFGAVQRNTAGIFSVNQSTVSRVFHEIIGPLLQLYNRFVIQPAARELSPNVELDSDSMQFNGAIGAIDGTHVRAFIALEQQGRWWSRKSQVSQNVLAAVNLEGRFVYVLAGAEGSIHDSALLRIALTQAEPGKLMLPRGCFYLADAGFPLRCGILTPFTGHIYHLKDFRDRGTLPDCEEEVFNYHHAKLRQVVERAFGMWKRKFAILRGCPPEYDFDSQQLIVYATAGIYNFILNEGREPAEERRLLEEGLTEEERDIMEAARARADSIVPFQAGRRMREHIAAWIWTQHGFEERIRGRREREGVDDVNDEADEAGE